MIYYITGYYSTGFDGVNVPDSPAMLDLKFDNGGREAWVFPRIDLPALDVRQSRFLPSVQVKATWPQVRDIDYIHLRSEEKVFSYGQTSAFDPQGVGAGDRYSDSYPLESIFGTEDSWYYIVTGVTMIAEDVAQLYLVPDYFTSIGGARQLVITGGITKRIKTSEAIEGVDFFTQPDPFCAPVFPMEIRQVSVFNPGESTVVKTVESTFDLEDIQSHYDPDTDPEPDLTPLSSYTQYKMPAAVSTKTVERQTKMYRTDTVKSALKILRKFAVEEAIIGQIGYSAYYVDIVDDQSDGGIASITGKTAERSLFSPLQQVGAYVEQYINKRARYSEFMSVGIMSCTGDTFTATPQECDLDNNGNVQVMMITDPAPDGRPYYILSTKTNPQSGSYGFLKLANAVPGARWKQLPLVWYEKSGNALDRQYFKAQQALRGMELDYSDQAADIARRQSLNARDKAMTDITFQEAQFAIQRKNSERNLWLGGAGNVVSGAISGGVAGGNAGPVGAAAGAAVGGGAALLTGAINTALGLNTIDDAQYMSDMAAANARQNAIEANALTQESISLGSEKSHIFYDAQRAIDKMQFVFSQKCVVPSLTFPYNSEFVRDFIGNGLFVFQYVYNAKDVERIDKILNAYGVVYTRLVKPTDFLGTAEGATPSNVPGSRDRNFYFSYVETTGLTVGALPRWLAQEVEYQINGGIRIWHNLHRGGEYVPSNNKLMSSQNRANENGITNGFNFGDTFLYPGSPWYYEYNHQNKVSGEVETYV